MPPPAVLTANNLCVNFGSRRALKDISFHIEPSEVLGLLGPNGAGKTTLVKSICGQILPSSGNIELAGKTVRRGDDLRKSIGLVPQDIGLYAHLSARENLDIFARLMGLPRAGRRAAINMALDRVGLTLREADLISTLSGGMKRRINFAAAILHNPALLILDEPTAGVDAPARDAIYALINELTQSGMAVLLVTHDLEQAAQLCRRILMLCAGETYGIAPPKELIKQAFGGQSQSLRLTLTTPPNTHSAALLAEGFIPQNEPPELALRWEKHVHKDLISALNALPSGLEEKLDIDEISIKKPGLAELIYKLETEQVKPV